MVRGEGGAGAGTAANGGTEGAQAAANAHAPLSETERIARELHAVSRLFGGPPRPRSSGRLVSDGIFARPDAATWKERKLALQRLTRLFESDMALVGEALLTEASLLRAMALQLADLRSEVVREGATCVCTFARAVAAGSSVSAAKLVGVALSALAMPLLRLVGSANRVMAAHGARAAVATFSALRSPKLLALFATTASADKNPAIRCGVARYVALCIEEWPRGIVGKDLESVEVALAAGAADASSECRTLTCGGLVAYYRHFTRRADALLRKLPEKTQRAVWEQLGAAIHGNGTPFSANDTEAYGSLRKAPDPAALERIAKRFEADRAKAAERGKAKREKTHDNGLANGLNTSVYGSRRKATDPTALEMIPKRSEDEHAMAAEPGKRDKAPDNGIANGSSAPVDGSLGTASPSASDHVVRSFRRSSSGSSASSNADPAALERRARRSEADLAKAIERGKARRDKVRDKGLPGGFNNSTAISPRDTKPAVPSEQKGNNAAPQVGKQGATSSSSPYAPIAGRVKGKAKAPTHVPKKSQQLPETQSPLMRTPGTPEGPGSPMRRGNAEMSPNGGVKSAPEGKLPAIKVPRYPVTSTSSSPPTSATASETSMLMGYSGVRASDTEITAIDKAMSFAPVSSPALRYVLASTPPSEEELSSRPWLKERFLERSAHDSFTSMSSFTSVSSYGATSEIGSDVEDPSPGAVAAAASMGGGPSPPGSNDTLERMRRMLTSPSTAPVDTLPSGLSALSLDGNQSVGTPLGPVSELVEEGIDASTSGVVESGSVPEGSGDGGSGEGGSAPDGAAAADNARGVTHADGMADADDTSRDAVARSSADLEVQDDANASASADAQEGSEAVAATSAPGAAVDEPMESIEGLNAMLASIRASRNL